MKNIMDLPLELARAIIAESMLDRGVKRAMRLRLVSKFFADEIKRTTVELRMLDKQDDNISTIGKIGSYYISQRLLSRDVLSPRLEQIRSIASRFAAEENDPGNYEDHIRSLTSLLHGYMSSLFEMDWKADHIIDYNLLAAAAYAGKLSTVKELCQKEESLIDPGGTIGALSYCSAQGGHTAVIDHILQMTKIHGRGIRSVWWEELGTAARIGARNTVEHLLASEFRQKVQYGAVRDHLDTLRTPDPEVFDILMKMRDTRRRKELNEEEIAPLLITAAAEGWESMALHLLELGAPVDVEVNRRPPLLEACAHGTPAVVRLLLQHGAKITGHEIGEAAYKGQLQIVRILIEHGADVNTGNPPRTPMPIVSAVILEHTEMFHLLIKHGATLKGAVGIAAVQKAKEAGLESMLELLDAQDVAWTLEKPVTRANVLWTPGFGTEIL